MTDIGDEIKAMRTARRLTRQDLAESAGVSTYSIRAYELGQRKPKQETIAAIMKALQHFPTVDEYRKDVMKNGPSTVDLALDNVGFTWKRTPLTVQQVSTMRTVVKTMVEPDKNK